MIDASDIYSLGMRELRSRFMYRTTVKQTVTMGSTTNYEKITVKLIRFIMNFKNKNLKKRPLITYSAG